MKKIYLTLIAVTALIHFSKAQNTFPSSGNVGIGTTSPQFPLHVNGQVFAGGFRLGSSATDNVNGAPGYGMGSTNLTLPGSSGAAMQFAGYWGINFQTNAGQMVMLNNGNIGIGTNNPAFPLHVVGQVFAGGFRLGSSATDNVNGAPWYGLGATNLTLPGSSGTAMQFAGYWGLNFQTGLGQMVILNNGNVGIGTISPFSTMDIIRSNSGPALTIRNNNTSTSGYVVMRLSLADNTVNSDNYNKAGVFFVGDGTGNAKGNMVFALNNVADNSNVSLSDAKMIILNNGSVGIGTTNPGNYKLAVNGGIHSQSVQIDMTGWSDYVFNPTYKLHSLSYLKAYINQNHHLPDMPSEEEVKNKGVDLGEMVKLQTKKIEELTLYLIEKDKQVKEQQIKINELESKLNTLIQTLHK